MSCELRFLTSAFRRKRVSRMWQAFEKDGYIHRAEDPETGATMRLHHTPEIDLRELLIATPEYGEMSLLFSIHPGDPPAVGPTPTHFTILILVDAMKRLAQRRNGSHEENSRFVRYVLAGMAALLRKWPLLTDHNLLPVVTTNLEEYKRKGLGIPEVDVPTNAELARIFRNKDTALTPHAPGSTRIP